MSETRRPALSDWERGAWLALLVLAAALRLWSLGTRPFHHDESIHAWSANRLLTEGNYKYDPVYHGPIQYFAVATSFAIFGDSDFTARFPAALGGVGLCAMALLLRRRFGPAIALGSGALLALSPLMLYYTRFCREDVWSLLGTAGIFLFLDRWLATKKLSDLCLASLSAAVAFASKENFYVLMALMVPSIVVAWMEPGRGLDVWNRLRRLIDLLEAHSIAILGALLLFFCVSEICYTVFLVHPESGNPLFDAISYWWGQHKSERVGGPKTYHMIRLLQYEFAILVPAFAWAIGRWRLLSAVERFLFGWGVSSILMYAYLGEKTPWLMVHQILPFVPLAAAAWVWAWERGRRWHVGGAAVAAVSIVSALSLSFWLPAISPPSHKAEAAIYVQTCPEMLPLVEQIRAFAKVGEDPCAIVQGEAGWPMSWYLRKLPVNWEMPIPSRRPPIVITDFDKGDEAAKILGPAYRREEVFFRAWWIPETSFKPLHPSPGELARYLLTRTAWQGNLPEGTNPVGSISVAVFRRGEAPPPPPAPTPAPVGTQPASSGAPANPAAATTP